MVHLHIPNQWNQETSMKKIGNKIDFKWKVIRSNKGHFRLIKGTINQEDITMLNIHAPNSDTLNVIK